MSEALRDLLRLQEEGVIVHSNLGKPSLGPDDIDPSTIDDPPQDENDERFLNMYFIGGMTHEVFTIDNGMVKTKTAPQFKVLAYIVFDDDTPMARRREVAIATTDLCRLFFNP